ncbi:MAG: tungstate ABC transporter substrate-binding protein WtpA [Anaerolineae bacterium]|nr:tungstate ABC transporter substrate-binding protein WtpA [Anaerolineae bacterium]MDW8068532.1 tungstate ABC transporter substrate-binding protein WtpA [Anaerolineae bacterium]
MRPLLATLILVFGLTGCQSVPSSSPPASRSGTLIIFHAGSLAEPIRALTTAFQSHYPGVTFAAEASGSNEAARKIRELGREADLVILADYRVIDLWLIPDFADWNIRFARNEMVLAYTDRSRYAAEIHAGNWYTILGRDGVICGRADPDTDPCGYRTLMVWQLAEAHYGIPDLYRTLEAHCPTTYTRPKSVELIALLQSGDVDYAFMYRSVALQHGLRWVELPPEINLGNPAYADFYGRARVAIAGTAPGTTLTMTGEPIVYGVTVPKNAPRPDLALEFVRFLISPEGQAIMARMGQPPVVPPVAGDRDALPLVLQPLVTEEP